jgi:hypothetical protein
MAMVPWRVDPRVIDPVRLAEIELFADLMIAATSALAPLPQDRVDRLLGIRRPIRVPFRLEPVHV